MTKVKGVIDQLGGSLNWEKTIWLATTIDNIIGAYNGLINAWFPSYINVVQLCTSTSLPHYPIQEG